MTAARDGVAMLTVFDGRELRGFILARGRAGFEAFDAHEQSLGTFPSQRDAANAIVTAAGGA